jgi:hypothetical protein
MYENWVLFIRFFAVSFLVQLLSDCDQTLNYSLIQPNRLAFKAGMEYNGGNCDFLVIIRKTVSGTPESSGSFS